MILAVAATPFEMRPFLDILQGEKLSSQTLVSGVGPVEAAVCLTKFLSETTHMPTSVLNFGIGGVYFQPSPALQPQILDICLAEKEVFGDFGISLPDKLEYLPPSLTGNIACHMDKHLLRDCRCILLNSRVETIAGPFITVNAISGTRERGMMLQQRWQGLCENMEGAAIARVCKAFDLPCLEMRCISNRVEDRNVANWRISAACDKAARTAILVVKGLMT